MAIAQREITLPVGPMLEPVPDRARSAYRAGLVLAAAAWAAMAVMWGIGTVELFGHDQAGVPAVLGFPLFLLGWSVMIAAMMLPSSLPALRRLDRLAAEETIAPSTGRFLVGYLLGWGAFGAAAFVGDSVLHLTASKMAWLEARPWLVGGGIAIFAGVAEFVGRTPPPEFPTVSIRGAGSFALGKEHAIDRIRRCWPLMLFAMAIGMANPVWMVGLTIAMLLELRPGAAWLLRVIGLALVGLGTAAVMNLAWAQNFLGMG